MREVSSPTVIALVRAVVYVWRIQILDPYKISVGQCVILRDRTVSRENPE